MTTLSEIVFTPVGNQRCSVHEMVVSEPMSPNDIELIGILMPCVWMIGISIAYETRSERDLNPYF